MNNIYKPQPIFFYKGVLIMLEDGYYYPSTNSEALFTSLEGVEQYIDWEMPDAYDGEPVDHSIAGKFLEVFNAN